MRTRYIQQKDGSLRQVDADYLDVPDGILICPDLPGYVSPVTGLWVEGRRARREDLKRTGSRPYEGLEQEQKEAARQNAYKEQQFDASLTKTVSETFYQFPPSKRDILRGT